MAKRLACQEEEQRPVQVQKVELDAAVVDCCCSSESLSVRERRVAAVAAGNMPGGGGANLCCGMLMDWICSVEEGWVAIL